MLFRRRRRRSLAMLERVRTGGTPAAPRAAAKVHAVLRKAASPVHTWQQVRQLAASELALGHPLAEPQEAIADELILIASVRSLERSGALVCSPPLPVNVAASCAPQWVVSNPDWLVRQLSRVAMAASCGPLPRIDRAERTGAPQSASNNEIDVSGSSKSRSNSRSNSTSQRKHRQRLPTPPGSASAGWLRVRHAIGPPSCTAPRMMSTSIRMSMILRWRALMRTRRMA